MNEYKGFSLIEILVVLAIVGILSSVAIPSYQASIERSNRAECASFTLQLAMEEEIYYAEHLTFTNIVSGDVGEGLARANSDSETKKCNAQIITLPEGNSCELGSPEQRCTGYTVLVTRLFRGAPGDNALRCAVLSYSNLQVKGLSLDDEDVSEGMIRECWGG